MILENISNNTIMVDANIQTRKLLLIEQFARITDTELISKIEALLQAAELEVKAKHKIAENDDVEELTSNEVGELEKRVNEYREDPDTGMSWDEMNQKLTSKHGFRDI